MRSKAIFMALLALAFGAQGAPVSEEDAAVAVRQLIRSGRVLGAAMGQAVDMSRVRKLARQNAPAFYEVPLVGGGIVYTSADTDLEPIVAFTSGSKPLTEKSPLFEILRRDAATRTILARRRAQQAGAGAPADQPATMSPSRKWALLLGRTGDGAAVGADPAGRNSEDPKARIDDVRVAPLLKTKWSQTTHNGEDDGFPCYDFYSPMVKDSTNGLSRAPSGCAATAAAQIMRYFQYPEAMPSMLAKKCMVDDKEYELEVIFDETGDPDHPKAPRPYAWGDMVNVPKLIEDPENPALEAIGHLTYDIGVAFGSAYTYGLTSADPTVVGPTFVSAFGYANAYTYWDDVTWQNGSGGLHEYGMRARTVYANLDARRPVFLGIYGYAKDKYGDLTMSWGGHAVVADGYGYARVRGVRTDYVHINLGWGGEDDAWYNIPEIDTAAVGALKDDASGFDFLYLGSATYNISADPGEAGKEIVSGRVTDANGQPFPDAVVRIFSSNGTDLTVHPDKNGIYYAFVEGGTNYDIRAEYAPEGRPPELIGWVKKPIFVGKTVVDEEKGVVAASRDTGNYWGADLVMAPPTVRFDGNDRKVFPDLDRALVEAREGTRIELLRPATLSTSVRLTKSMTLTATNENPLASQVVRVNGATLTVGDGTLSLVNVAFSIDGTTPVYALKPGRVSVEGRVRLNETVTVAPGLLVNDVTCFVLAGLLENGLSLGCDGADNAGDAFGTWTCDLDAAKESAPRIVTERGVDRAGAVSETEDGVLCWNDNTAVDPMVAVGYVDGDTPVYYRTLDRLFDDRAEGEDVVLTQPGAKLEKARVLTDSFSISAAGSEPIVVYPVATAGFTLAAGCQLDVSGVTFRNYTGNCLFLVNGEEAQLKTSQVVFEDITGTNRHSGAVAVFKGSARLTRTDFTNCRADGTHVYRVPIGLKERQIPSYGGALYLDGDGCLLSLDGGSITGCSASQSGGGVYAETGSMVEVGGDLVVKGNKEESPSSRKSDIFLQGNAKSRAILTVASPLTGTDDVGVRYGTDGNVYGNKINLAFATAAEGVAGASAAAFFNDVRPTTTEAVVFPDGTTLGWRTPLPEDYEVDPSRATVLLVDETTPVPATSYYARVEHAFAAVKGKSSIVLLTDLFLTNTVEVVHPVTFRSRESDQFCVTRLNEATINVLAGGDLTLADVLVSGGISSCGLVNVNQASLTLDRGAVLCSVYSYSDRAASAVSVWNGGTFTMEKGAEIRDCHNEYYQPGSNASYGGGLAVEDSSRAYLNGGSITNCSANRGGGVFIGTKSLVFVSGDMTIADNTNQLGEPDNLCVADLSDLLLTGDGALGGTFGYNEGKSGDTNVFGRVAADFKGSAADAQASAHRFTHDVTGDVGLAVSDGSETLFVWGSALDSDGVYTAEDGKAYELVEGELVSVAVPEGLTFTYDGSEKTGVTDGIGYVVVENGSATEAGTHEAVLLARPGFVLDRTTVSWTIEPADFELGDVAFEDQSFPSDGEMHYLAIKGTLPDWLSVDYENNGRFEPGTNEVTAVITGSSPNYEPNPYEMRLTAKLIIEPAGEMPSEPSADPVPPEGRTVDPEPIAFQFIDRLSATEWKLTVTNAVRGCWYSLRGATTLAPASFEQIGERRQATEDGPIVFEVTVPETDAQWFWNAVGEPGESLD